MGWRDTAPLLGWVPVNGLAPWEWARGVRPLTRHRGCPTSSTWGERLQAGGPAASPAQALPPAQTLTQPPPVHAVWF